jgi:hypothetical protein
MPIKNTGVLLNGIAMLSNDIRNGKLKSKINEHINRVTWKRNGITSS